MKIIRIVFFVVLTLSTTLSFAQNQPFDFNRMRWGYVANRMPEEWYGSDEAKRVADNVLIAQKEIGGWAKNKPYHHEFTQADKDEYINGKKEIGGTFDNGATITEIRFLAKVYAQLKDERYKKAFLNGLNYVIISQYENGGWPQYYPVKNANEEVQLDHTVPYSMHITYNDNAMVNTLRFLKAVFTGDEAFSSLEINNDLKEKAKYAFDKGLKCILNTQIMVDGKPTVWCAQHNEVTLEPANARSYELASFSGSESVGVVMLLMDEENPSKELIASVKGAVSWFENHKIEGIKVERITGEDGKRDRIVIEDKNAPALWGRFCDLETGKPFFCSRDGIKKNTLAEISYERRNGYSWYTNSPQMVLDRYPGWLQSSQ